MDVDPFLLDFGLILLLSVTGFHLFFAVIRRKREK